MAVAQVDMQAAVAAAQAMAAKFSQEHEGAHVVGQYPVSSGAAHAEDAMGGVKRKFDDDGDEDGMPYKRSGFHGPGEMPEPVRAPPSCAVRRCCVCRGQGATMWEGI